jgi:hypothetical protein
MTDCSVNNAALGRAGTGACPYETIYVFGGGRAAVADCFVNRFSGPIVAQNSSPGKAKALFFEAKVDKIFEL